MSHVFLLPTVLFPVLPFGNLRSEIIARPSLDALDHQQSFYIFLVGQQSLQGIEGHIISGRSSQSEKWRIIVFLRRSTSLITAM